MSGKPATRQKTGGRVKGTANKANAAVKEALADAFEEMGGSASLAEWGKENRGEFYKLWVKIMPPPKAEESKGERGLQLHLYLPDNGRLITPEPKIIDVESVDSTVWNEQ